MLAIYFSDRHQWELDGGVLEKWFVFLAGRGDPTSALAALVPEADEFQMVRYVRGGRPLVIEGFLS